MTSAGTPEFITFVIPVFNECDTLVELTDRIRQAAHPHPHRILYVDDGSTDGSAEVLRRLHGGHAQVDVIRFQGNRGKSAALAMGFAEAEGDWVVTLDADLQDDPGELPKLLARLRAGADLVVGWKKTRRDPWHKVWPSRVYNRAVSRLFRLGIHDVNSGFKAMRREVAACLSVYGEMHRLIPVMAAQMGFRVEEVAVEHHPRRFGRSKYGFERFVRGALDVLTARFLARYGHAPNHFFGKWGFVGIALGVASACAAFGEWLLFGGFLKAQAFGIAAAGLLVGGFLMVAMGLLAELLVRHARTLLADETRVAESLIHK